MKFKTTSLSALLFMASLLACSPIKEDQSGVTITGNTASIHGQVVLANGTALARKVQTVSGLYDSIMVYLLQEIEGGYEVDSMSVDSLMAFRFEDLEAGVYTLQAKLPNGELLTEAGIRLSEGQSRKVDLRQGGSGMGTDSMVVWEVDIACRDSTVSVIYNTEEDMEDKIEQTIVDIFDAVLYGPGDQAGGIQIRMLEQPMAYYGRMYLWQETRGTKIAIRFPRNLIEGDKKLEILFGIAKWATGGALAMDGEEPKQLFPEIDTIPNRRMRISWDKDGPTCTAIDSIGIPHVSCSAYKPPQVASLAEIQNAVGSVFRDMVNELGVNDSISGYVFFDEITRTKSQGLQTALLRKEYFDTASVVIDTPDVYISYLDLDKAFYDSIPKEVFEGLNADTLLPSIKIGGQLNHSNYWNKVPGIFYDKFVTPYTIHHVPFDSSIANFYFFRLFADYVQPREWLNLNRYEDYALISESDGCSTEQQTLLRRNASGVYKLIKRWYYYSYLTCD